MKDIQAPVLKWCKDKSTENLELVMKTCSDYVKRISYQVSNTVPTVLSREDLTQCGLIAILESLKKYDPDRGIAFKTVCYRRVRGAMIDMVRKMSSTARLRNITMVSLDDYSEQLASGLAVDFDASCNLLPDEASESIIKALNHLSLRQQTIFLFLLNGLRTKHISNILEISAGRIREEKVNIISSMAALLSNNMGKTVRGIFNKG